MITMTATEAKAKFLALLDQVGQTGETIQITKRGHVVAEITAPSQKSKRKGVKAGFAAKDFEIVGDIVGPLGITWDVAESDH